MLHQPRAHAQASWRQGLELLVQYAGGARRRLILENVMHLAGGEELLRQAAAYFGLHFLKVLPLRGLRDLEGSFVVWEVRRGLLPLLDARWLTCLSKIHLLFVWLKRLVFGQVADLHVARPRRHHRRAARLLQGFQSIRVLVLLHRSSLAVIIRNLLIVTPDLAYGVLLEANIVFRLCSTRLARPALHFGGSKFVILVVGVDYHPGRLVVPLVRHCLALCSMVLHGLG